MTDAGKALRRALESTAEPGAGALSDALAALLEDSAVGPAPLTAWRASSAAPLASNSSLNLFTKLNTGQAQASPKAQMVRPWMFFAMWIR